MRDFFDWWIRQLISLIPSGLMRHFSGLRDAAILHIEDDIVSLFVRRRGSSEHSIQSSADEAGIEELLKLAAAQKNLPRRLVLRLPPGQVLRKELSLPIAVLGALRQALGFEIDRETPFARDEIYWNHVVQNKDVDRARVNVELFLIPRASIDHVLAALRKAKRNPIGIEVEHAEGARFVPIKFETATEAGGGFAAWIHAHRPQLPFFGAVSAAALLVLASPFIVQQWALASTNAAIEALSTPAREAASLRRIVDQDSTVAAFVAKERVSFGNVLPTLAEATKAVPDDSYLTRLSVRGGRLTITGLSASAALLVGLLDESPNLGEPRFDAPVVPNEELGLENFTISVALAGSRP